MAHLIKFPLSSGKYKEIEKNNISSEKTNEIQEPNIYEIKNKRDKKSTKKDQTPLCIATSNEGMYFISLKKSG